ncbi:helix-turn-helix domain-containing protein [Nocardia sp. NEAU-G5]|uniref:Helix-turn-helix domain-containing protein n=1 Tax=Nocardia albiluteola TaxID=2842303 RepID=A0ABS6B5Y2_9NOCA|nr:AraC family transcriptional regulator [Nocardia albiluteola]MBU3062502.1 helix-turn-helix domain-containing protein [Nocardia albiluteola]MBU3065664.1 helix-turn-helix domain-containing protein [Nocardia albiluteola]
MTDAEYRKEAFSTDDEDPAASWDEYLRHRQGTVGLRFRADEFSSTAFAQNVGQFQIVEFTTATLDYRRSQRNVRADGDNSYRLFVPLQGHFKLEQGDSREIFHPGKVGFFHWGRPVWMTHDETISALIMTVPERSIDPARAAAAPLALDEKRPLVHALETQVRLLAEAEGWTAADFSVAFSSALTLLDGALNLSPAIKSGKRATDAERARLLIKIHANDPRVNPETIATMLGIGERTLYKVLKSAGYPSPGAMLRTIRIERAHRRLSTALPVDMDRIAFEEGFPSTRRFREAYREHYGQTPARMREQLFGARTAG